MGFPLWLTHFLLMQCLYKFRGKTPATKTFFLIKTTTFVA